MGDISKLNVGGTLYDIKDAKARTDVSDLKEDINTPNVTAEKNVFPEIYTGTTTKDGITFTYGDGKVSASGTATVTTGLHITDFFALKAGRYIFSEGNDGNLRDCILRLIDTESILYSTDEGRIIDVPSDIDVCIQIVVMGNKTVDVEFTPVLISSNGVKSNKSITDRLYGRSKNLANKYEFVRGQYISNTGAVGTSTTYFYTGKIPVSEGEVISFKSSRFAAYYNGSTFVSGINNPSSPQTVPSGVDSVILSGYMADVSSFMVNKGRELLPYEEYIVPLQHKIRVFGDSWTDIVNTTYVRWPVLINKLTQYDVKSYGVTGSNVSSHVATQISNYLLNPDDHVDTFIVMGGINDYRNGIGNNDIITAVTGYYNDLKSAFPNARFIYLANNQLFYSAHQLKYFNTIVETLNINGIEAYDMFAWIAPNQYATDFLHPGNNGNVCIANNILKLLEGGKVKTVVNKLWWELKNEQNTRVGQVNIYEFFNNGYPRIEVRGVVNGTTTGNEYTLTISTRSMYTSAPWSVLPHSIGGSGNVLLHSPYTETLDSNNQVLSFDITLKAINGGIEFTTDGNAFMYSN